MDVATLREHLAQTERHVAESEERVSEQRARVTELTSSGLTNLAWAARMVLADMERLLARHIADRDRLVKKLAEASGAD